MGPLANKLSRGYYYLAPLWFVVEAFLYPDLRAGPIVGHSLAAVAAFYAVEGGIGTLLWKGLPGAQPAALTVNVAQLIAVLRFILFTPMDAALFLDGADSGHWEAATQGYARAIPGAIVSGFQLVHTIRAAIDRGES